MATDSASRPHTPPFPGYGEDSNLDDDDEEEEYDDEEDDYEWEAENQRRRERAFL